ncbi:hypothetical protein FEM03_09440 [Phragmitibacter flavus]|uniref:Uncharacterized protein n=1 Tax=Phragmitibacter flavus TaxID=2576071 RepID=A0A5R8KFR7_9BACT|nr:hypothetical protein [Phragmitibacter flavus]TLD71126.1 hypothetical protein FEM03_09440 [Phragmitibacter flavus]
MNYSHNPFQELYVADSVDQEHFVRLFSSKPMDSLVEFHQLFQAGNVVLLGSQGCGKTMLLTLLRPEIRIAYRKYKEPFPVPADHAQFLSAGINLTKSGIAHLAGVTLGQGQQHDIQELPYYFGDLFNYKVILDLMENLKIIEENPDTFGSLVSLSAEKQFVKKLIKQDCWAGALNGCQTSGDLMVRIKDRIACYRNWMGHNMRFDGAPKLLRDSKSMVGEPILRTVDCLKSTGVIDDVPVFIRIDQIEELVHAPAGLPASLRLAFRQMLNGALGKRDLRVAYRLGSRPYGWNTEGCLGVFGGGVLEEERDYHITDFDAAWRRTENVKGTFEIFAKDAFLRRIKYYLDEDIDQRLDPLEAVFSCSALKRDRTQSIFSSPSPAAGSYERALAITDKEETLLWSKEWKSFLSELFIKEPLEAVLAAAWGRQTGGGRGKLEHRSAPPPTESPYPWENQWWRKERLTLAALQLAARRGQRLMWWGKRDILDLSGGNILAFLGICHGIWNQFLKIEQGKKALGERQSNPLIGEFIDRKYQALGIQEASKVWYNKLAEHKPGGDIRQRFIGKLGNYLRRSLREDKKMSYPGGNGFSLEVNVLELDAPENRIAWSFLKQCVGWGALVVSDHTTKKQSGEQRLKFYLHPVLSPVFQLPVAHTKEPLYWEINQLIWILKEAEVPLTLVASEDWEAKKVLRIRNAGDESDEQLKLF